MGRGPRNAPAASPSPRAHVPVSGGVHRTLVQLVMCVVLAAAMFIFARLFILDASADDGATAMIMRAIWGKTHEPRQDVKLCFPTRSALRVGEKLTDEAEPAPRHSTLGGMCMRRRIFAGELLFGVHHIHSAPGSNDAFASKTHRVGGLKGLLAAGTGALECAGNLNSVIPTTCVRAVLERNVWCLAIEPADPQTPQSETSRAAFQLFGISLANSTAAAATVATAATTATTAKAQHGTTPTSAKTMTTTTNPTTTVAPPLRPIAERIACAGNWADNSGKVSGTTYTRPHMITT